VTGGSTSDGPGGGAPAGFPGAGYTPVRGGSDGAYLRVEAMASLLVVEVEYRRRAGGPTERAPFSPKDTLTYPAGENLRPPSGRLSRRRAGV
jgi:hypothetical protein